MRQAADTRTLDLLDNRVQTLRAAGARAAARGRRPARSDYYPDTVSPRAREMLDAARRWRDAHAVAAHFPELRAERLGPWETLHLAEQAVRFYADRLIETRVAPWAALPVVPGASRAGRSVTEFAEAARQAQERARRAPEGSSARSKWEASAARMARVARSLAGPVIGAHC